MPDLRNNMFLSPDMSEVIAQFRLIHTKTFSLAEKLNELAHQEMFETEVTSSNAQQLLIACLLHRALTTFQGVIVLTERGMPAEATTLLRTLLEVMFRLVAIAKDSEVGRTYILQDEFHRKKFINKFKLLSEPVRSAATQPSHDHDSLLTDINHKIAEHGVSERSTLWFAEQAGLADFYHSAYSVLSGAVHANVRDIESALVVDENGNVTAFDYGPSDAGIDEILLTAIESLIFCLRGAFSVLPSASQNALDSVNADFITLHQEIFAEAKA
mgnify:CR=1 FL=1